MRILLIAYDFPPIPSPQSLRWAYLVRELHRLDHQVHVLAPDVAGYGPGGLPGIPDDVVVHRVYPGRVSRWVGGKPMRQGSREPAVIGKVALAGSKTLVGQDASVATQEVLNWKGRTRRRLESFAGRVMQGSLSRLLRLLGGGSVPTAHLNWKGCIAELAKLVMSKRRFPDYRAEWLSHAVPVMERVMAEHTPDLVVVSHEPACALPLAFTAERHGIPWVADLGDPVLASYTPARWRKHASRLEREICAQAGFVSVTTESAAQLLATRHAQDVDRFVVITQGFDSNYRAEPAHRLVVFDPAALELLYTGSFYDFRRADALIKAVEDTPGVRLTVATIAAPDYLSAAVERLPHKFRLVGFLPHVSALAAQRECDVLVNLANADPIQVPGKVYEYLGAGRAMLHIRAGKSDSTCELLRSVGAGWDLPADAKQISELLRALRDAKASGGALIGPSSSQQVLEYSWQSLAQKWVAHATALVTDCRKDVIS